MEDSGGTRLTRAVAAMSAGDGVHVLPVAKEAFAARVLLARAADRTLDVQYYIWHPDTAGCLLLRELWDAAERGVRVRLLLDDNGTAGLDPYVAALDAHPRIAVRLFHPFRNRRFRALGYLTNFRRLNRRMHNKSFTADSVATIVGGRNVGDEYFGVGGELLFADLDVLAVGRVARDVQGAFEQYWEDAAAVPARHVVPEATPHDVERALERLSDACASDRANRYEEAVRATPLVDDVLAGRLAFDHAPVRLVCDPPAKARGHVPGPDLAIARIRETFDHPTSTLDIVSPYFVPGRVGRGLLAGIAGRGIPVRVVTNSLAATDVAAVHAGYARHRPTLLHGGVQLFELRPDSDVAPAVIRSRRGSRASLHAKTFAVDRKRVFIGSLNLDQRSMFLNTEMGLIIDSPAIAGAVADAVDRASADAWSVERHGRRISWLERTGDVETRHRTEPLTSIWKRSAVRILGVLPVEWLL